LYVFNLILIVRGFKDLNLLLLESLPESEQSGYRYKTYVLQTIKSFSKTNMPELESAELCLPSVVRLDSHTCLQV